MAWRSPASWTSRRFRRWPNGIDIPATRVVTIPPEFANDQFVAIPKEREDQAKLERMGYGSLGEKIAERFHTTEEVLAELNPQLAGGCAAAAGGAATGNEAAAKAGDRLPGRDAASRAQYRCRPVRPVRGQGRQMGRHAAAARRRNGPAQGREDRGRQVRPGAPRTRWAGQAARPVHRDHGVEPVPAAARHMENPGRRLQPAVAI